MCDSIPVRLIFATTDPGFYNNGYKWKGQMYVAVSCGSEVNYTSLDTAPFTWNFCNTDCRSEDYILTVLFTFKPNSIDPNDHLKFMLDTRGYVISRPSNIIKDDAGKDVDLDIESVSRYGEVSGPESLMEVWIGRGAARGVFLPRFKRDNRGIVDWGMLIKTLGIGIVIVIISIALMYFIERKIKQ